MKYMGWDWAQLQRCKLRHYRALMRLLAAEARQAR